MSSFGKPEVETTSPGAGAAAVNDEGWLQLRIKLRPDLQFEQREQQGRAVFLVGDPVRNKFFQVGELERRVISAFDGTRTVAEVAEANFYDVAGQRATVQATQVAKWLVQHHLATIIGADNSKRVQERARNLQRATKWGLLNLISLRFPLFNPTPLLDALKPLGNVLFHPVSVVVWLILMLVATGLIWQRQADFNLEFAGVLSGQQWIWLLLIWSGLKAIHELAHGLACRRYGGEVPEAGVLLLLLTPLAYVNVTSSWKFRSRWQRMTVAAAGMYLELFVAAIAAIIWTQLAEASLWKDLCLHTFIMASVTTVLFNANALMKFDGYYLFSDLVEIPNLYGKGTAWIWDRLRVQCLGWQPQQSLGKGWDRWIIPIYAVLSAAWRVLVSIGLIIGAGVLFHGVGLAIAATAVFSWYLTPAIKQIRAFSQLSQHQPLNWYRLGGSALIGLTSLIGIFLVFSSPASKSAPAIVRFENESVLRAGSDGFVQAIHVKDGQRVNKGQLLVELENSTLVTDVHLLEAQLEECRIQVRQHLQARELAKHQAELERKRSLEEQLAEKLAKVAELQLLAPFDGVILQRNLAHLPGCFLKQGEPVLTVAESAALEIVVSIEQDDFAGVQAVEGNAFRAVFPGAPVTACVLKATKPSASTTPVHEAMCASYGGPLAVKPKAKNRGNETDRTETELLTPRFNLELAATGELQKQLNAGQSGWVVFPVEQHSLGTYWYLAATRWLERKIDAAMHETNY